MENKFDIRSKLYVKPTKGKAAFRILLWIVLVIVLISGIITIISEGMSIGTVGYMALAFIIVSGYSKRPANNPRYEPTYATVTIGEQEVSIEYKQLGKRFENLVWTVRYDSMTTLEYSDQLECLHILGDVIIRDIVSGDIQEEKNEHLLYIEKGKEYAILTALENASGEKIIFVDR